MTPNSSDCEPSVDYITGVDDGHLTIETLVGGPGVSLALLEVKSMVAHSSWIG